MALNRSELVAAVAEKSGNSQAAVNGVLDAVFEVFTEQVSKGEKVSIPGWLSVERTERAARTGRNPQTGETILPLLEDMGRRRRCFLSVVEFVYVLARPAASQ